MISTRTRACLTNLLVAGLAISIGGCSDEPPDASETTDETTGETTADEQICADWAQLEGATMALVDVDVVADGTDALRAAVDGVADAFQQLRATGGEQVDDEIDALGTAMDRLAAELSGLTDRSAEDEAGSGLVAVGEAVQGVSLAAQDLGAELQTDCDA